MTHPAIHSAEDGEHENSFSDRLFEYRSTESKKLTVSLTITLAAMVVEVIGGLVSHSIALISDAGHMFTHAFAIGISLAAIRIARKPLCHHRTFGLYRAEILAAFVNGIFLLVVAAILLFESVIRMARPQPVESRFMLIVAVIGLLVNGASIAILHKSRKDDLNIRSVFFHMIADAVSSLAVIACAVLIGAFGWTILDPLVGMGITALIVFWAWGVLRDSGIILLEMAPSGLNVDMIEENLKAAFPDIIRMTNTHLWSITSDMRVFSAHVVIRKTGSLDPEVWIHEVRRYLHKKYKIVETTVEIKFEKERERGTK
jgi:cobalt-zinc-cadmium efflux system protein